MEHREIITIGDAKALSDLQALLVNFKTALLLVEPTGRTQPLLRQYCSIMTL
jgi:hypothetical protein